MRRVALGSGLELGKLASTVRQIVMSDPPIPVLICQAESNPDAWVHLSLTNPPNDDLPTPDTAWLLILGYPLHEDIARLIENRKLVLPPGSRVIECKTGLQATLRIPVSSTSEEIARSVQRVMIDLQGVEPGMAVELALEYP